MSKVTTSHWDIITNFMELHPDFARNRIIGPTGRETMKKLWEELTNQLNSLGLGERSVQKWQKTWTDYKYVLKRKAADIKKDISGTGGGPPKGSLITQMDERILSILGTTFYEGLGLPESGLSFITNSDPVFNTATITDVPGPSGISMNKEESTISTGTKRNLSDHDYIKDPLRKQPRRVHPDEKLNDMYRETLSELREIKSSLQDLTKTAKGIENALIYLGEIIKNKREYCGILDNLVVNYLENLPLNDNVQLRALAHNAASDFLYAYFEDIFLALTVQEIISAAQNKVYKFPFIVDRSEGFENRHVRLNSELPYHSIRSIVKPAMYGWFAH